MALCSGCWMLSAFPCCTITLATRKRKTEFSYNCFTSATHCFHFIRLSSLLFPLESGTEILCQFYKKKPFEWNVDKFNESRLPAEHTHKIAVNTRSIHNSHSRWSMLHCTLSNACLVERHWFGYAGIWSGNYHTYDAIFRVCFMLLALQLYPNPFLGLCLIAPRRSISKPTHTVRCGNVAPVQTQFN